MPLRLTDPAVAGSVSPYPADTPTFRRRVRHSFSDGGSFRSFRRWGEVGYAYTLIRRQALSALHHRQFHEAGVVAGVEDLDRALLVVAWFGLQNVGDVSLRIAIVKGEPA